MAYSFHLVSRRFRFLPATQTTSKFDCHLRDWERVCVWCVCVCFVSCARRGFSNEIAANYSHYVFGGLHFKLIVVYISQSKGQRNGALWFAEEDGATRWMIEFWNRNRQ